MTNNEITVWGIHAGAAGQGDELFLRKNVIAIGWKHLGNLAEITPDRESFKADLSEKYPETKPGAIPVHAGVLYRFIHEMQIGDMVIYPSKVDRQIHIGHIKGEYQYSPKQDKEYPHYREVKWQKGVPR